MATNTHANTHFSAQSQRVIKMAFKGHLSEIKGHLGEEKESKILREREREQCLLVLQFY